MSSTEFRDRAARVDQLLTTQPLIRAVNFHNTSRTRTAEYQRQFDHYRRHFAPVDEDDLDLYLRTGRWDKAKPGLILAFYEGYRNHYDVILPMLEHYGLIGWFFVITGFVASPVHEQRTFAAQHDITTIPDEYADGRYALNWMELREIDRRHVVASHAHSHSPLASLGRAELENEVLGSQRLLTEQLGHVVRSFVSYGGPAYGELPAVDRLIDAAGYQFVVSNFQIQRIKSLGK